MVIIETTSTKGTQTMSYVDEQAHKLSVAQTIIDQIKATGGNMVFFDWGTSRFNPKFMTVQRDNMVGVKFRTAGLVKWKGWVEIMLNEGADLYELRFYRMRRPRKKKGEVFNTNLPEMKIDKEHDGVCWEDMSKLIDLQVLGHVGKNVNLVRA